MRLKFITNRLNLWLNIVGCIIFLFLPLITSPRSVFFETFNLGEPEIKALINSFLLILVFYTNLFVLIPRYFQKKRYRMWLLINLGAFVLSVAIPYFIVPEKTFFKEMSRNAPPEFKQMAMPPFQNKLSEDTLKKYGIFKNYEMFRDQKRYKKYDTFRKLRVEETSLKFIMIIFFALLIQTRKWWKISQEEKMQTELSYLKMQVNPHFLFNTLNGIYMLSLTNPSKTPSSIIKLSELMRYVISEIKNDYVPLSNEIDYIRNYIELQKIRMEDTVEVNFTVTGDVNDQQISPLLLIPLVENAFKYGITDQKVSVIGIRLNVGEKEVEIEVENKKSSGNTPDNIPKNNTGLANLKRRLDITYPNRYQLIINDNETDFKATLSVLI